MRPRPSDPVYRITISGLELEELKRLTYQMVEAFGLDRRIESYQGKRPIGFHAWDLDCLEAVLSLAVEEGVDYPGRPGSLRRRRRRTATVDGREHSERRGPRYEAVKSLYGRIKRLHEQAYGKTE